MEVLTFRERQIINYLIKGYDSKQIAEILNVSEKTIRNHISNVIIKLDVKDRLQAIIKLIKLKEIIIYFFFCNLFHILILR